MDLPNLRKKPPYDVLLSALQALEVQPNSWNKPFDVEISSTSDQATVQRFLMSIIASDLEWLQDSVGTSGEALTALDRKELLFDLASRRVAERCGRSAMPEMTRTWTIPESSNLPEIKFNIREPPLTGDNLGLKTWGTSYVVARKLENFGIQYLDHLFTKSGTSIANASKRSLLAEATILELGAGTGLVGIAAGAIWGADVYLTDLQDISDNLLFNVEKNTATVGKFRGNISSGILDWREPDKVQGNMSSKKFKIILAADPLYDDDHPALLANVIHKFLQDDSDSRVLVAVPMRDDTTKALADKLFNFMVENGFLEDSSGEEICQDDWESSNEPEVKLRWTFWKRNPSSILKHEG
ncbi:hypothetical protein N431DRAFT_347567 [Stipitochalara longipes BDJ]|nr:hypothetical protein N431DRAFT_347567 [Stipitochalara longipes BDJ]